MLGPELGGAVAELDEEHLVVGFFHFPERVFP